MVREIWCKGQILALYNRGKDIEVRIRNASTLSIEVGDILFINKSLKRRVIAIREYPNFRAVLGAESSSRILPGYTENEVWRSIHRVFKPSEERKGILVFELEKL